MLSIFLSPVNSKKENENHISLAIPASALIDGMLRENETVIGKFRGGSESEDGWAMPKNCQKSVEALLATSSGSRNFDLAGIFVTSDSNYAKRKKSASRAIKKAKSEITRQFDLQCIGVGTGYDYEKLSLDFYYYKPITRDEARSITLTCAKIFGNYINESRTNRHSTEITHEKYPGAITIHSMDKQHHNFEDPYIAVVIFHHRGLMYFVKNKGQEFGYKETIEEALEEAEAKNDEYLKTLEYDASSS